MAGPCSDAEVRSILLDIEGTTTPIEFVYDVLFPYARNHIKSFIQDHYGGAAIRADIERLQEEHAADMRRNLDPPPWRDVSEGSQVDSIVSYLHWLMDRDRKSTALKSLQGKIWEAGYRTGELRGQLFEDVPFAFERWLRQKRDISIFSSGSIFAQKLLFAHTTAGDLTRSLRSYFDTTTGPKTEADSYRGIAAALGIGPGEILFLSDVIAELDAARLAGMDTALCVRSGRPAQAESSSSHRVIHSFAEIYP